MHLLVFYGFREFYGVRLILSVQVVEDTSSYLGLPTIEITEHIGRDHMDMCRFTGPNDLEYRKVASALTRMTNTISKQSRSEEKSPLSEQETRSLLESLRFDQINARQMTIKKAHAKTCKWLFTKLEYLDWLDRDKLSEHHGFLWIKGKPGTGKSTLMKSFLANTKRMMKDKVVISFFFNARGEDLEKSTLGTYQSLLLQLLERLPTLKSVFETLDFAFKTSGGVYQWTVDTLKELLEVAVLRLGDTPVVCLIDALDECEERQIRDMITFLEHIGERTVSANISFQVCFSSRHYPHISIKNGRTLILEGQEGHSLDITSYLESELKIGNSKVAKQVRGEIQEKASGVFLWVVLVVEILNKEHDSGRILALRRRLREIPGDLHELFNDILTRDSRNRDELILCVQWVLFARHPLTPEELYFAIVSGSEPQDLSIWDSEEISMSDIQRFILDASKGLAETTSSKTPKVQFIHESVKDFLVKENGLGRIWSDLGNNFEGQSHEKLKQCCVNYMNVGKPTHLEIGTDLPKASSEEAAGLRNSVSNILPFLEYATHHVLYHADQAEGLGVAQVSFLNDFQLTCWIRLSNLFEKHEVRRHTTNASLLYLLAEYDMSILIRSHPSILSLFETENERYGCPLFASLATGSEKSVQAFMQALVASEPSGSRLQTLCQQFSWNREANAQFGRDFQFTKHGNIWVYLMAWKDSALFEIAYQILGSDTKGLKGRPLLSLAAEIGHESVVKQLLDERANVDSKDGKGRTPLMLAALYGHEIVARLLLDFKATNDAKDNQGSTPLWHAATNGHAAIVKLLLENRATVDSENVRGATPLMQAAQNGHEAVVNMLLANEAHIESISMTGETSLMLAAENGHEITVKLLLENSAAINSQDQSGWTPLMRAAANGHVAVVSTILENGAAIEPRNTSGLTSLMLAAKEGHEAIVRLLLLENKAAIDSQDQIGWTPLMLAAANGHVAVVSTLLENGAAIKPRYTSGLTSLMLAAIQGREIIVKMLLLKDGAAIDSQDCVGRTPLVQAVTNGRIAVVSTLLENEAGIDLKDYAGNTPLLHAVKYGLVTLVKMLLDTGKVDVNSMNKAGDTPLYFAARNGIISIAKMLLDTGKVNVNVRHADGGTPLSLAVLKGYTPMVKLLLDTDNVDVNARDANGDTPLMNAARQWSGSSQSNCEAVVTLLLDTGKVDVFARNEDGKTARNIAAVKANDGIVKLLDDYVALQVGAIYGYEPSLSPLDSRATTTQNRISSARAPFF